MKRLNLAIFAVLVTALTINAQVFIGGSASLSIDNNSPSNDIYENSKFEINILPQIGFVLNEKWSIGLRALFGFSNSKISYNDIDNTAELKISSWGGEFFGRYKLIEFGATNFSLNLEASTGIYGNKDKQINKQTEITLKSTFKSTTYDINARPFFAYKLSENFDILAYCNFLNIGYSYQKRKPDNSTYHTNTHSFDLGINSASTLTIGFLYKF